jgi:ferritin
MKLSESVHKALNEQIGRELKAHFLYRAIAFDLYDKGYLGFSAWMDHHAQEEYEHAERIIAYLKQKDARVRLDAVNIGDPSWGSVKEAVQAALEHEQWLTEQIHTIHDLASEENDKTTIILMDWFVEEQKEEEMVVGSLMKRMKLADYSPVGLMVIDTELKRGAAPAESDEE